MKHSEKILHSSHWDIGVYVSFKACMWNINIFHMKYNFLFLIQSRICCTTVLKKWLHKNITITVEIWWFDNFFIIISRKYNIKIDEIRFSNEDITEAITVLYLKSWRLLVSMSQKNIFKWLYMTNDEWLGSLFTPSEFIITHHCSYHNNVNVNVDDIRFNYEDTFEF